MHKKFRVHPRWWTAFIFLALSLPAFAQNAVVTPRLSSDDISSEDGSMYISDVWKFHAGDNSSWANPALVDTTWQPVSTYLGPSELPFIDWNGIGWFRFHFRVDSTLLNFPLALLVQQHNGASDIYLDGMKISSIGNVAVNDQNYQPKRNFTPVPFVISDTTDHVIAVRYANHEASYFNAFKAYGFTAGFRFLFGDLNARTSLSAQSPSDENSLPVFLVGALLAFTVIHFLLFLFYPAADRNLYFALFTGILALLIYALYITVATDIPLKALFYYRFSLIGWLIAIVLALRFAYSLLYEESPFYFWIFGSVALVLVVLSWTNIYRTSMVRELFVVLTLLEILRVLLFSFFKRKKGVWIIALGLACFAAGILYKILVDVNMLPGEPAVGSMYGTAAFIFAMSVYLSQDFAKTNRRLEQKLLEVKHLSRRSLAQERLNQKKELESKLLAADNHRKSKELEEARALQLSMLPKRIPNTPCWDIAVFMETAHEVGGDYYDFSGAEDGTLTIALGDATGHGMKAGIMVAAAKSYFHTLADESDLLSIIRQMSTGIRNMDLKMMYMGFLLFKIRDHHIRIASAGMPPALWYHQEEERVTELLLKGLPMGTKAYYPYNELAIETQPGDALLLMSDGLPELFNGERRQLGQQRIRQVLQEAGKNSASDILSQLTKLIEQWSGGKMHEDDITLLVMKAK